MSEDLFGRERPGGMLEISDALSRDLDKAAEGKIPPPPIEAFMSDSALEQAERATRAAGDPVHAEDLRPISGAEAALRTTFDGEHLPAVPAARRVIPPPFRRPRVSGGRHGKVWQPVRADHVHQDDMTELVGKVARVITRLRREDVAGVHGVATGLEVVLIGVGGVQKAVDAATPVRVHRPAQDSETDSDG